MPGGAALELAQAGSEAWRRAIDQAAKAGMLPGRPRPAVGLIAPARAMGNRGIDRRRNLVLSAAGSPDIMPFPSRSQPQARAFSVAISCAIAHTEAGLEAVKASGVSSEGEEAQMLTDLDEALLTVRDSDSRTYIREAVIAYRGGAYRAAVVSVWVAVIYDIISKLRLLDSQGDRAAQALIQELDKAISSHDIKAMGNFEEKLPGEALRTFEFLSRAEYEDFERLKADRNRCAHPAFSGDTLLYSPSPESVRAHIVHAIDHLLGRPPVQGKAAIERILMDIAGPYFPTEQDGVNRYLCSRYLDNAKASLVANLMAVLVKALLRRDNPVLTGHEPAALMALAAIAARHSEIYRTRMQDLMRKMAPSIDDANMPNLLQLVGSDPSLWGMLDEPTRIKCRRFVDSYSPQTTSDADLLTALSIEPLREPLIERLRGLDESDLLTLLARCPRPELSELAVILFVNSGSFRGAEARARVALLTYGKHLTLAQIRRALAAVPRNVDIWDAINMPGILETFFRVAEPHLEFVKDDWERMMQDVMANIVSQRRTAGIRRIWDRLKRQMETASLGPFQWPTDEEDEEEGEEE